MSASDLLHVWQAIQSGGVPFVLFLCIALFLLGLKTGIIVWGTSYKDMKAQKDEWAEIAKRSIVEHEKSVEDSKKLIEWAMSIVRQAKS